MRDVGIFRIRLWLCLRMLRSENKKRERKSGRISSLCVGIVCSTKDKIRLGL